MLTDPSGHIREDVLKDNFSQTTMKEMVIPLHVRAQNAGIIIRSEAKTIYVESFELSALNVDVMTTKGRLRRYFPETAVSIPQNTFAVDDFQTALAAMISKMSHQAVVESKPRVRKARQSHAEDRDTTNPCLVTQLLSAILRPHGDLAQVSGLWKNTRDEVVYSAGNRLPWRRSPTWLLLRIVLQLTLARACQGTIGDGLYKRFMVFFISIIIKHALSRELDTETIFIMNAKLARRIRKLDIEETEPWMVVVHETIRQATSRLNERWTTVIESQEQKLDMSVIVSPDIEKNLDISLPKLDVFIGEVSSRTPLLSGRCFIPTSQILRFPPDNLPCPRQIPTTGCYQLLNIAAFEHWVAKNLETWISTHLNDSDTCSLIKGTLEAYHAVAIQLYGDMPEGLSVMILTILELWVACDKSAVATYPMLAEYDPEVSSEVCGSLLLRFHKDMKRLSTVEQYILLRGRSAFRKQIFTSFGTQSAFSVRYFGSSRAHQERMSAIEKQALEDRQRKCKELERLKERYTKLMAESVSKPHDYIDQVDNFGDHITEHSPFCSKCSLIRKADRLTIDVHEWPLPMCHLEAQSTVFEMDVPIAFSSWRDLTIFLRDNVLAYQNMTDNNLFYCDLDSYRGLFSSSRTSLQRIVLASKTKPHTATHRCSKSIAVTEEADVFLQNGLQWSYFDKCKNGFLAEATLSEQVSENCTFSITPILRSFLRRPWGKPDGPQPNCVVAKQADCPDNLSVDEFKALCLLPLGHKIQWENLLIQLAMPSVDWRKLETVIFAWQISHQTGPPSNSVHRASHKVLEDDKFVFKFCTYLAQSFTRLKENWESSGAVGAFVILATRLLSLGSRENSHRYLSLLGDFRQACSKWLIPLRHGMLTTRSDEERSEFCQRTLQTALIGIQTFDVDDIFLSQLLQKPGHAAVFIEFSIAIRDTARCVEGSERAKRTAIDLVFLDALLLRHRRLVLRARTDLINNITLGGSLCLNDAIQKHWQSYRPRDQWAVERDCWLSISSYSQDNESALMVHFNVVTAELLVNGLPLSRLPLEYENHETYRILLGQSPIEVVPSAEPGMRFSSNHILHEHQLHFFLKKDLLVRASKHGHFWDYVPPRVFGSSLPMKFTEDYVHWYDVRNDVVEFRPKASPWLSPQSTWRLSRIGSEWRLQLDNVHLLNPSKSVAVWLLRVFQPLENISGLHFCYNKQTRFLEIDIPRLQLQFDVSPGSHSIKSRQYRDMCVDTRQGSDTLIGLKNKLFLHKIGDRCTRMILIPHCIPRWQRMIISSSVHHVAVTLGCDAKRVQPYHFDNHLGRLVGNGSLQSKLFLAELHALTSSCLPDPFTRNTGTEEALTILQSAGVWSFDRFSEENLDLLCRLANLAPGRTYYPPHLKVMQVVDWDPKLSYLSQHGYFFNEVSKLFRQAKQTAFLFLDSIVPPDLNKADSHLLGRDNIRSSTFRLAGFGAESFTTEFDKQYVGSRDGNQDSLRAMRASVVAASFISSKMDLPFTLPKDSAAYLYTVLSTQNSSFGGETNIEMSKLQYDSYWLNDPKPMLQELWLSIHQTLSQHLASSNPYRLMTWMATMAFSKHSDETVLAVLVGLTRLEAPRRITVPKVEQLHLTEGLSPSRDKIRSLVNIEAVSFDHTSQVNGPRLRSETNRQAYYRRRKEFLSSQQSVLSKAVDLICSQWPSLQLDQSFDDYFRKSAAIARVANQFRIWNRNKAFHEYLERICCALSGASVKCFTFEPPNFARSQYQTRKVARYITFNDVLMRAPLQSISDASDPIPPPDLFKATAAPESNRISELLKMLDRTAESQQEVNYVKQLKESADHLHGHSQQYTPSTATEQRQKELEAYYNSAKAHYSRTLNLLSGVLGGYQGSSEFSNLSTSFSMIADTYLWPRVSARLIVSQLNRQNWRHLTDILKETVVAFGTHLTQLQASERLVQLQNQEADLHKEICSLQPRTWNPLKYPDTLLLEIEGNLRMREAQEEIASMMGHPPGNKNTVMQLNMGEGKSSVIVPVVAASLADTSCLVRVIVARPQSRQMFEMLVAKLGGLIGRRIYHMPFSRSLRLGVTQADFLGTYYEKCRRDGGVLLLQPENILSFQLMVIETTIKGESTLAQSLLKTQLAFDQFSRDIVDESDENFSTKFELIYTMGQQRPIDFAPERWIIIQHILRLVAKTALRVKTELPESLEIEDAVDGRYPRIRFLDEKGATIVLGQTVTHLCDDGPVPGFPIAQQSKESRTALQDYISQPSPAAEIVARVEEGEFWALARDSLLLIRGLFSSGLLAFIFGKKRWRVNYGLDSTRRPRTRLAVPYQAKDKPSLRSEFSHPDVVISLTSLAYYYRGLDDEELLIAFDKLSRSDQADMEYQLWVASAPGLPPSFRHLQGINLRDTEQCRNEVFPSLKFSKGAIDYFLSRIVFVKEMKEFPEKLSASGWDIGRVKCHPTTGFSGTNDSRNVLPLDVKQLDLDSQKHTNALVLEYLLCIENSVELLSKAGHHGTGRAEKMLESIVQMPHEVRVILDVGAQIVEMTNEEVARAWLSLVHDPSKAQAVIFCDDSDNLCVLDRNGHVERLQTSPFAKHLGECLVYLDEAHTRGIDLRLPQEYRAVVTLGTNVVKDRLVQACMRMRKLGFGQSVVFFVPNEIETKIRKSKASNDEPIMVADILVWSMHETWADILHSIPIWATQGCTFIKQQALWAQALASDPFVALNDGLAKEFLADEAQSLEKRYRPCNQIPFIKSIISSQDDTLRGIIQRCGDFENLDVNASSLQEEQERELSPEIEHERQKELAPPAQPLKHYVHPAVRRFAKTGKMGHCNSAFMWAFEVFADTTAAAHFDVRRWPRGLLITRDFARTVEKTKSEKSCMDDYQRNIQWVLTNTTSDDGSNHMVVLSPFEANALRDEIASSRSTVLHIYAPRQNLGFPPIDDLDLYAIPSSSRKDIPRRLVIELNLFAGQLYFNSFKEYTEVCEYLGLAWKPATHGMVVKSDGFIVQNHYGIPGHAACFEESPIPFLKAVLIKIRHNTEGIENTHLGKILYSALLTEDEFEK
ncbi:hypothetical protein L228DRAFT_218359 [Xylona heveae TC161]|uniref:ubiquitinyl hydrolase 1 n=1 Tax=Xylona heveae (strain CBS 132557 / TC161) TaxID=1328760 RepID=A0A165HWL0_XYLHT|nr:hypothetical protein L228DRAFT_218359 [Xylona heveae TC161]KZF24028.1 hypothetical protein L228DRAFT_218359 [Xylona heveae TC161]